MKHCSVPGYQPASPLSSLSWHHYPNSKYQCQKCCSWMSSQQHCNEEKEHNSPLIHPSFQAHGFFLFTCKKGIIPGPPMQNPWCVALSLCGSWHSWKRGPPLRGQGGMKWPRPADSTACSQDSVFSKNQMLHQIYYAKWQLSISFLFTELIASDTGATAQHSLLGDWFQSLALDTTCIFKVKGLSQCRDYAVLCILKNLKLAVN